jgi:stage II sporulation protein D
MFAALLKHRSPQTPSATGQEPSPPNPSSSKSSLGAAAPRNPLSSILPFLVKGDRPGSRPLPILGWLASIALLGTAAPAQAGLQLRVAVEDGASQVQVGTSSAAIIRDGSGRQVGQLRPMEGFSARVTGGQVRLGQWQGSQLWVEPEAGSYVWIGDRWYRGRAALLPQGNGVLAVNHVDLEEYLYSVVGEEMPPSWPLEALKSQAVAARSYALYKRNKLANAAYDLGDTTSWQVYGGVEAETTSTQTAVLQTAGQVLTYQGQIIEAVFHSSSGGHTENVEDVWSSPLPYLRGVADYDQSAPVFSWQETFSAGEMRQLIPGVGNIIALSPVATTPNGRIREMKVIGDAGQRTLSGEEMRRALDLRSSLFTVIPTGGSTDGSKAVAPTQFVVQGRGFGHGLGLSQWGANSLASQGYNYQQILGHYYQSAALAQIQVTP